MVLYMRLLYEGFPQYYFSVLEKHYSVENAAENKSEIYTGKLKIPNNTTSGTAVVQWWCMVQWCCSGATTVRIAFWCLTMHSDNGENNKIRGRTQSQPQKSKQK